METMSIMNRNGKKITFDYFDSLDYVYKKLCTVYDSSIAISILKEFENMKKRIYNKAYLAYLEKVRMDSNLGIIETLLCSDGSKIYVNVFDSENTIFRKYEIFLLRKLNDNEKEEILNYFDSIVKRIVEESIFESKVKLNNGRKI